MSNNWRLPTKAELNAMYIQLHAKGLGGFKDEGYWSSSDYDSNHAWGQHFGNGHRIDGDKDYDRRVRLVRDLPKADSNNSMALSLDGKYFEVTRKDGGKVPWHEAMREFGWAEENNSLEAMTAERDEWKAKAMRYLHLLALVEDDVKDAHTLGIVRAVPGEE
jgi:hypothetical protein